MSQSESKRTGGNTKSKSLLIGVVAASIIVIAALVGVIVFLLTRPKETPKADISSGRGTVVTPENVDEILAEKEEPKEATYYTCNMNVEWNFKDSASPSYNAFVANHRSNQHTVYFNVYLEDTMEMVYSSPYIPVGSELTDITLDTKLDAGDYPCIVTYHLVDEDKAELSTVSVTVTLHVEN